MDHPVIHFSTIVMAFFAIMNPIANAPVFIGMTAELDAATRRAIALRAVPSSSPEPPRQGARTLAKRSPS